MPIITIQVKVRKFQAFDEEELHVIYDGLVAHGGDSADEALIEEIEEECALREIRIREDWGNG